MTASKRTNSLADFKRNAKVHLKRLKNTGRPEILTVNGEATLIVQNAAAFFEMMNALCDARRTAKSDKKRKPISKVQRSQR